MKKIMISIQFLLAFVLMFNGSAVFAQDAYQFTDVKRLPTTSVKDQFRSGTCWSFSGLSFLESEMLRMGKKDVPDLSQMFVVRNCYFEKAINKDIMVFFYSIVYLSASLYPFFFLFFHTSLHY